MNAQEEPGSSSVKDLMKEIGVDNIDSRLANRALTHRSYINEHPEALEDNERLEFLGDAVLDFMVGAWLYHQYPEMQEGELTRLRSALVRTDQLAEFARKIGLGSMIHLGKGESENGGRNRPAILCGTFEALVGALYLHGGIPVVEEFIKPFLMNAIRVILSERKHRDPKSLLQEWAQSRSLGTPVYRLVSTEGPEHDKSFEVEVLINKELVGVGGGSSKQAATKSAAAEAIKNLEIS